MFQRGFKNLTHTLIHDHFIKHFSFSILDLTNQPTFPSLIPIPKNIGKDMKHLNTILDQRLSFELKYTLNEALNEE